MNGSVLLTIDLCYLAKQQHFQKVVASTNRGNGSAFSGRLHRYAGKGETFRRQVYDIIQVILVSKAVPAALVRDFVKVGQSRRISSGKAAVECIATALTEM